MKKILGSIVVVILIIIGLVFIFNAQIAGYIMDKEPLPKITVHEIKQAKKEKPIIKRDEIATISPQDVIKAKFDNTKANYIGYVFVPSLNIKVPIVNELTNYALTIGAGVYYEDMEMGKNNYVLASHFSYVGTDQLFTPLYYNISHSQEYIGKSMYLTDLEYIYEYKIDVYKVVTENETHYIDPDSVIPLLTLFTCNYNSESGRVLLQGKFKKKLSMNNESEELEKYVQEIQ